MEGVGVVLERGATQVYATLTERNGFYQLGGIEPGVYNLIGRSLGHLPSVQAVTLGPGGAPRAHPSAGSR